MEFLLNSGDVANGFLNTDIAPLDPNELLDANLFNLNSIPIDNGSFGGVAVPYDLDFILKHTHQTLGGSFGYMMSPIVQRGALTVRPVFGGRYLRVEEGFRFFGVDSNLLYNDGAGNPDLRIPSIPNEVDDDGDFIVDNHINDEDGNGGNITVISGGIIRSQLVNEVTSNMAGPEFALRYDIGDISERGFSLFGQTKVGVMLNQERIKLFGDNIGAIHRFDPLSVEADGGFTPTEILLPTADNPNPNAFEDSKNVTRVSPLFEQSFQAEFYIFDRIPVLDRVRALRGARLRAGFTWLWIGGIATPDQSVLWQANPSIGLFPQIDVQRDDYSTSTVNLGLSWDF